MKPTSREQALFTEALRFATPEARVAYLDGACGTDTALRRRVEALLRASESAGDFLEQPPTGLAAGEGSTLAVTGLSEKPGDRIGRYKLLEQIGEGGCGVVYMAEQEEPVRRRVALKVIKLGFPTEGSCKNNFGVWRMFPGAWSVRAWSVGARSRPARSTLRRSTLGR